MQLFHRFIVAVHHGSVGKIGARHDEYIYIVAKEQIVQRGIRQHNADKPVFTDMLQPLPLLPQQDDRTAEAVKYLLLVLRDEANFSRTVCIAAHDRERLFIALLAAAQLADDGSVIAAAGKVYPAEPLDSDDLPGPDALPGKLYRVALHWVSISIQKEHLRAAVRAAVRLGMIAPILNIAILPVTVRAHGKGAHRCLCPVIGHVLYNGEPRAAVGAVDERIAVTPVAGRSQLTQAVVTDAYIRGNERVAEGLRFAAQNSEILVACQIREVLRLHRFDDGKLRCAVRDILNESGKLLMLPFQLKLDPGGGVFYISPQAALLDELMDKRPEADPLNDTVYVDQDSLHRIIPRYILS